jgi:hypothetical protein
MKEKYNPIEVTTRRYGRQTGALFLAGGLTMAAGGGFMVKEAISAIPEIRTDADKVIVGTIGANGAVITASGLDVAWTGGLMLTGIGMGYKRRGISSHISSLIRPGSKRREHHQE